MIEGEDEEEGREDAEDYGPRKWDVGSGCLEHTGHNDEQPLPGHGGDAVECGADADVERLFMLGECEHVETVGCDVVCG